jgi:hypothetical protein
MNHDVTNLPPIQKEENAAESDCPRPRPSNDEGMTSSDGGKDAGSESAVAAGENEVGDGGAVETAGTTE